jgi:hypothetical protein
MTYLVGTCLYGEIALAPTLVSCILAVVHLGITAPLKSISERIEVVSASHVLGSGYLSAHDLLYPQADLTHGDGWSGDSTSCTFVSLEITRGGGSGGGGSRLGRGLTRGGRSTGRQRDGSNG